MTAIAVALRFLGRWTGRILLGLFWLTCVLTLGTGLLLLCTVLVIGGAIAWLVDTLVNL